jgi:dienelactone hydrolase
MTFTTQLLLPAAVCLALASSALATVQTKSIEYKDGDVALEGYLAWDDAVKGAKRPGILVVHEWTGIGPYVKGRCEQLAKLGYVAFAADIYGKGVRPTTPEAAGAEAGKYRKDRALLRARVAAGLAELLKSDLVDPERVAAIGYCFGGMAALELARAGADLRGVVSFHGGLGTPLPADGKTLRAKVLALHGADDPNVPPAEVAAFEEEMRAAKADWQLVAYGGAVHSFTNPSSGDDPSKGVAYNEKADHRSWTAMRAFFGEIFK